jgi:hypothetical protein
MRGSRLYPDRFFRDFPIDNLTYEEASCLKRLYISVDAYLDSPCSILDGNEIISRCILEGPDYATYLKRVRRKSFQTTFDLINIDKPEWWDDVPSYRMTDIGNIFNYKFLIPWEENPEDYECTLDPVEQDPEYLKEYVTVAESLLPDDIQIIDPISILLDCSGSGTESLGPNWKAKEVQNSFTKAPLAGRYAQCTKSAGDSREILILNPSHSNTVKWIDAQTWELVSRMRGNAMIKDPNEFYETIDDFGDKYNRFFCRDLKKEGLMKPRNLITSLKGLLTSKYPEAKAFEYLDIYNDWFWIKDGETIHTERGHGLGMANALTTLMQLIIAEMVTSRCEEEYPGFVGEILAYNDDSVAGFGDLTSLETWCDVDERVVTKLGHKFARDKSFKGDEAFVFCEIYKPDFFNRKISYQRREILNALTACNIVQAKGMISSLTNTVEIQFVQEYLTELITYFGYEFHPNEYEKPSTFGGWYSFNIGSVSLDAVKAAESWEDWMSGAFIACKNRSIYLNFRQPRPYKSPAENLFTLWSPISPDIKDALNMGKTYGDMRRLYSSSVDQHLISRAWRRLYESRQKAFEERYPGDFDIYKECVNTYPSIDFLPPRHHVIRTVEVVHYRKHREVYSSVNPLLAALAFEHPLNVDVEPNPYWYRVLIGSKYKSKLMSSDLRKKVARNIILKGLNLVGPVVSSPVRPLDEADDFVCRCYLDPGAVTTAWELYYGMTRLPLVDLEHPLMKYRDLVYGRSLSLNEERFLQLVPNEGIRMYVTECPTYEQPCYAKEFVETALDTRDRLIKEALSTALETRAKKEEYNSLEGVYIVQPSDFWLWKQGGLPDPHWVNPLYLSTFNRLNGGIGMYLALSGSNLRSSHQAYREVLSESEYQVWKASGGKELLPADGGGWLLDMDTQPDEGILGRQYDSDDPDAEQDDIFADLW